MKWVQMSPNESKRVQIILSVCQDEKNASNMSIFGQNKRKTKVNTKLRIKVVVYHKNENLHFGVWTHLDPFGVIWTHLDSFGSIS